jgi:hypothetical protein
VSGEDARALSGGGLGRFRCRADCCPVGAPPGFFISVDSKRLSVSISLLESVFGGIFASIDSKELGSNITQALRGHI